MTTFLYQIAPTRDGNAYRLRRVHFNIIGTFTQFVRVETLDETFPMTSAGRMLAHDTVKVLNSSKVAA